MDIRASAHRAVATIDCDGLLLDALSVNTTIPDIRVASSDATVAHEATVGKINEDMLFYLESHGIPTDAAKTMVVNGFLSPLVKELPLEYASEMNVLISMEMEGGIG